MRVGLIVLIGAAIGIVVLVRPDNLPTLVLLFGVAAAGIFGLSVHAKGWDHYRRNPGQLALVLLLLGSLAVRTAALASSEWGAEPDVGAGATHIEVIVVQPRASDRATLTTLDDLDARLDQLTTLVLGAYRRPNVQVDWWASGAVSATSAVTRLVGEQRSEALRLGDSQLRTRYLEINDQRRIAASALSELQRAMATGRTSGAALAEQIAFYASVRVASLRAAIVVQEE